MVAITRQVSDIHIAFHSRRMDTIKAMLDEMPTLVDAVDAQGRTLLHRAVWWGEADLVALLLEYGARADIPNSSDYTALNIAVTYGSKNVQAKQINRLLAAHANNAFLPVSIRRCFASVAVQSLDASVVQAIFTRHPDEVNRACCDGKLPLSLAVKSGRTEVIAALCNECGADPNVRDENGNTALFLLETYFPLDVARTLISAGADVNGKTEAGETILHWVVRHKFGAGVVHLLIAAGADVNARAKFSETPLHHAANRDIDIAVLQLLLDGGADVDARTNAGDTPLMYAAFYCQVETVRLLISRGANVHAVDGNGNTALHRSAVNDGYMVSRVLVEAGADPDAANHTGVSSVHASMNSATRTETIILLLSNSRRYSTRDPARVSYQDIKQILLDEIETNSHGLKRDDYDIWGAVIPSGKTRNNRNPQETSTFAS